MNVNLRIILSLVFCTIVYAQKNDVPINITRLNGPITLDGIVDENTWQSIVPFEMTSHWPEFGNSPSDHTEIRLAYDDNYIYVSGIMHAAPENILAASFKRDLHTLGTDYLTIVLDTFNDNENALLFATTPTGNRNDLAISDDVGSVDVSWDTFWDVESVQDENGWSA